MRSKSTLPALLSLALGYFTFGTSSLALVGLSPSISGNLHVPAAQVALLISIFALTFAGGALLMPVILSRLNRKHTLLVGLAVMALGGFLSAMASSYGMLAGARVIAAVGAAAYAPQASAAGSLIVTEERRARALATVFSGMTAAAVLGVPLATFLGNIEGWRWALVVIGGLTVLALLLVAVTLPPVEAGERPTLAGYRTVLVTPGARPTVLTTLFFMGAQFTIYGVAAAYIEARVGASASEVSVVLLAFGVLGVLGNAAASKTFGALGGSRTISLTLAGVAIAFVGLILTPAWLPAVVVLFAFWAFFSQLYQAPQQARLVTLLPDYRAISLALNASTMYVGVSLGSLLGGSFLPSLGPRALSAVGLIPLGCALAAHVMSTQSVNSRLAAPVPNPVLTRSRR